MNNPKGLNNPPVDDEAHEFGGLPDDKYRSADDGFRAGGGGEALLILEEEAENAQKNHPEDACRAHLQCRRCFCEKTMDKV